MTDRKFKVGDRVKHRALGHGTVSEVKVDGTICVSFDDWKSRGEYDPRWFELYPNLLAIGDSSTHLP